ncbi:MAG: hypothetical protein QM571_02745 [Micrococcaceae bacterium]
MAKLIFKNNGITTEITAKASYALAFEEAQEKLFQDKEARDFYTVGLTDHGAGVILSIKVIINNPAIIELSDSERVSVFDKDTTRIADKLFKNFKRGVITLAPLH